VEHGPTNMYDSDALTPPEHQPSAIKVRLGK
jgi:hypothetical protein